MKIVSVALFGKTQIKDTEIIPPFRHQKSLFFRAVRRFLRALKMDGLLINKRQLMKADDDLIFFDGASSPSLLRWAAKHLKSHRLIFWFWNPVRNSPIKTDKIPSVFEIWSYSKKDCEDYGFRWNSTFLLWDNLEPLRCGTPPVYDAVYIGRKKNQSDLLEKIEQAFIANGISFHIVLTRKTPNDFKNHSLPRPLPYSEYIAVENSGKAILDIGQCKTAGLTLRLLEAAFFRKKIICNYLEPLSSSFPQENIFYFDDQVLDFASLKAFLNTPFVDPPSHFFEYYSFESWVGRFDNSR